MWKLHSFCQLADFLLFKKQILFCNLFVKNFHRWRKHILFKFPLILKKKFCANDLRRKNVAVTFFLSFRWSNSNCWFMYFWRILHPANLNMVLRTFSKYWVTFNKCYLTIFIGYIKVVVQQRNSRSSRQFYLFFIPGWNGLIDLRNSPSNTR